MTDQTQHKFSRQTKIMLNSEIFLLFLRQLLNKQFSYIFQEKKLMKNTGIFFLLRYKQRRVKLDDEGAGFIWIYPKFGFGEI